MPINTSKLTDVAAVGAYAVNKTLENDPAFKEASEALPKVEERLTAESTELSRQEIKNAVSNIKADVDVKSAMNDSDLYSKDQEAFNKKLSEAGQKLSETEAAVRADKMLREKIYARQQQLKKAKAQSNYIFGKKKFVNAVLDESLEQAKGAAKKILTGGNK